jgi:hypothetical protein
MQDMRLLMLCLLMFMLVIASCLAERPGQQRLGLLRTFKQVFYLDNSMSEIKTLKDLQGYLRTVTGQARLLQPVSDYYFKESEGEIRVFEGVTEGWTKPLWGRLQRPEICPAGRGTWGGPKISSNSAIMTIAAARKRLARNVVGQRHGC